MLQGRAETLLPPGLPYLSKLDPSWHLGNAAGKAFCSLALKLTGSDRCLTLDRLCFIFLECQKEILLEWTNDVVCKLLITNELLWRRRPYMSICWSCWGIFPFCLEWNWLSLFCKENVLKFHIFYRLYYFALLTYCWVCVCACVSEVCNLLKWIVWAVKRRIYCIMCMKNIKTLI